MSDAVIVAFVLKWGGALGVWIWAHKILTGLMLFVVAILTAGAIQRPVGEKYGYR